MGNCHVVMAPDQQVATILDLHHLCLDYIPDVGHEINHLLSGILRLAHGSFSNDLWGQGTVNDSTRIP